MTGKAGRSHPLGLKNRWFGFDEADSARILPTAVCADFILNVEKRLHGTGLK